MSAEVSSALTSTSVDCEYVGVRDGICLLRIGSAYLELPREDGRFLTAACAHPADFHDFISSFGGRDEATVQAAAAFFQGKWQAIHEACSQSPRRRRIRLQVTLFPASWVTPVAEWLGFVFFRRAALALALVGLIILLTRLPVSTLVPASPVLVLLLTFCGVIVHEFGHAAACARCGVSPGRIGLGLYLVFPVAFSDVTNAWRLERMDRVLVNVGGIYLQGGFLIAVNLANWRGGLGDLSTFNLLSVFLMLHALNPCFRSDGFWLLADLSGTPNPHRRLSTLFLAKPPRPGWRRKDLWLALVIGTAFAVYSAYVVRFMILGPAFDLAKTSLTPPSFAAALPIAGQVLFMGFGLFILFVLCRPVLVALYARVPVNA